MSDLSASSSRSESDESDELYYREGEDENVGESFSAPSIAVVEPKILLHPEASECLCTLGKCDSGLRYAYLVMDASNRHLVDVRIIPTFKNILRVNVSGNHLTMESLQVLASMSFLLMLEADRNGLFGSPKMDPMPYLQVLTLNRNNLTDTEGILHPLLETLELNYNRITKVSLNPQILKRIKVLELRGNFLSTTNDIYFPSLVRLYIAENEIDRLEGLEHLVNLKILHLRDNRLSSLYGFQKGPIKLNYLNLRNNKIKRLSELRGLQNLTGLETLVILGNSMIGEAEFNDGEEGFNSYRIKVLVILPNLKKIDKDPVLEDELSEAASVRKQMLEDGMSFSELDEQNFDVDE